MSFLHVGLRRAAARIARSPFVCRQCLHETPSSPAASKTLRLAGRATWRRYATTDAAQNPAGLASAAKSSWSSSKTSYFPDVTSKAVGYWLIGSGVSVVGLMIFGGLTRLTESGLSITEWRPVTGSLPPFSAAEWQGEFDKYRASPEFQLLNPDMELGEFKKIYYMEWTHRLWGRVVGLTFVVPTAYFIARRRVTGRMAATLVGISALIGFQGFVGWWMVRSGLRDDLFAPGSHPRVSQYRLATHLGVAALCYTWMLLAGLAVLRTHRLLATTNPAAAVRALEALRAPALTPTRRCSVALALLVLSTSGFGALVAGLDAGLIYNEFPTMGANADGGWRVAPPATELWDRFYSRREDGADLWWRNLAENPSTVQLAHRILATTTFCAVAAFYVYSRRGRVARAMPADARRAAAGLLHVVSLQAALGISTLIYMVPTALASAHQAGALGLLTMALVLATRLHVPPRTLAMLRRRVKAAAKL